MTLQLSLLIICYFTCMGHYFTTFNVITARVLLHPLWRIALNIRNTTLRVATWYYEIPIRMATCDTSCSVVISATSVSNIAQAFISLSSPTRASCLLFIYFRWSWLGYSGNQKGSKVLLTWKVGLKVIYHPLYGMNNYVLIWSDWLSCDPPRGSPDSQSPHIRKHVCPIFWQLWFICHKFIHTI